MARTHKHLFEQVVDLANVIDAYRKARRRKRCRDYVLAFDRHWEENLVALRDALASGSYGPGPYHNFYIHQPKRRLVSAAPFVDRIVHHAIVNVIEPIFDRSFIYDTYACRKGKGTHRALDRCHSFVKRHPYYLKGDVVKFFPSVDHGILLRLLRKRIADERLMALIEVVLDWGKDILAHERPKCYFPGDNLFSVLRPAGLPIGNLTSQFFANIYLNPLDHFVKEELRVKAYLRYADDFALFGRDKQELCSWRDAIEEEVGSLRLRLHPNKTIVSKTCRGLKFLGFKLYPSGRRVLRDSVKRFRRRLKRLADAYARGKVDAARVRQSVQSWVAHTDYANSVGLRRQLLWATSFKRDSTPHHGQPPVCEDPRFSAVAFSDHREVSEEHST